MDVNPLTNDDVADILALLDSLPYDELDLETPRFRLTLRRTHGRLDPVHPGAVRPGTARGPGERGPGTARGAWGAWHITPIYRG